MTCTTCACPLTPATRWAHAARWYCGYCYVVEASEPDDRWPPWCGGSMYQKMRHAVSAAEQFSTEVINA